MPIYSLPLTLAELLEVQGTALNDSELWALLYATSKSLSDLFSQGTVAFVIMSVCVRFSFCIGCTYRCACCLAFICSCHLRPISNTLTVL